jgi:hypothetical protein
LAVLIVPPPAHDPAMARKGDTAAKAEVPVRLSATSRHPVAAILDLVIG